MIRRVVMFETMGTLFPTAQKAQDFREGEVERFLRTCPGFQDIPRAQRIAFVQAVLDNRARLRELLDFAPCNDSED